MKTGALDYILKPFKLSVILPVLSRALNVRRLRMENAELERHLRQRTAELEATTKELEAFSYSVSHDLRAPLRAIDGFCHVLQEDFGEGLDARAKAYLDRVCHAADQMGMLIGDLLRLAQVSCGEMQKAAVDLTAIAQSIATELRISAPDRRACFTIAPDVVVHGDARLLEVALTNLLRNAWKYTGRQTAAHIEFGIRQGAPPTYFVADNGAGFDMRNAGKLFAPFGRLHSEAEFEGTGVGLATVDRIIRRHSGRIWAESAPGKGAVFLFTLDLPVEGEQRTVAGRPPPARTNSASSVR
jgi:hypothetical protein